VQRQKFCSRKFYDPKDADCGAIFDAEREARLTPCESDKLKSARRTRLLGVFVRVCYGYTERTIGDWIQYFKKRAIAACTKKWGIAKQGKRKLSMKT